MGTKRCFTKDYHRLMRTIDSFTAGQAKVVENPSFEDEEKETFVVEFAPSDGAYKGGKFKFLITANATTWPDVVPNVCCQTKIYHPNIDTTYEPVDGTEECNVCVSLIDDWSPDFSFDDLIQAILFLFYEPNVDDALSPYYTSLEDFEENVKKSLAGGEIDGYDFEPNYGWLQNNPDTQSNTGSQDINETDAEKHDIIEECKDCEKVQPRDQELDLVSNEVPKKTFQKYQMKFVQAFFAHEAVKCVVHQNRLLTTLWLICKLVVRACQFVVACNYLVHR